MLVFLWSITFIGGKHVSGVHLRLAVSEISYARAKISILGPCFSGYVLGGFFFRGSGDGAMFALYSCWLEGGADISVVLGGFMRLLVGLVGWNGGLKLRFWDKACPVFITSQQKFVNFKSPIVHSSFWP